MAPLSIKPERPLSLPPPLSIHLSLDLSVFPDPQTSARPTFFDHILLSSPSLPWPLFIPLTPLSSPPLPFPTRSTNCEKVYGGARGGKEKGSDSRHCSDDCRTNTMLGSADFYVYDHT